MIGREESGFLTQWEKLEELNKQMNIRGCLCPPMCVSTDLHVIICFFLDISMLLSLSQLYHINPTHTGLRRKGNLLALIIEKCEVSFLRYS